MENVQVLEEELHGVLEVMRQITILVIIVW